MDLYNNEEIARIEQAKKLNDSLEEFFLKKREKWTEEILPLFETIKLSFTSENASKITDCQSLALSYRQNINLEISLFLNKRSKEEPKIKKLKQDKFIFYATGVGLKTNMGEKSLLIDAHIGENDRYLQLIETHIEFLRNTSKSLESLGYTIKNIIELMNYLGRQ